jgi:hypothetical protein
MVQTWREIYANLNARQEIGRVPKWRWSLVDAMLGLPNFEWQFESFTFFTTRKEIDYG